MTSEGRAVVLVGRTIVGTRYVAPRVLLEDPEQHALIQVEQR